VTPLSNQDSQMKITIIRVFSLPRYHALDKEITKRLLQLTWRALWA